MNQPNKNLWGTIVAVIITGSAGISIYKSFAESQIAVITRMNEAKQQYRNRDDVKTQLQLAKNVAKIIEQHKAMNDSALARGGRALYNDKITALTQKYNEIIAPIAAGEKEETKAFEGLAALKNSRSALAWLSSIALALTMPLCAWLLAFLSVRMPDLALARAMFTLSFVCEFISALIVHDGLVIMIADEALAKAFAFACFIALPFVYKGIAQYAFNPRPTPVHIDIFSVQQLPEDWRAAVIAFRQGRISPDLSFKTIAEFYQARGVKLSEAKFFKESRNGKIVPLNYTESDLTQQT